MNKNIQKLFVIFFAAFAMVFAATGWLAYAEEGSIDANIDGIDEMVVVGTDGYIYAYNSEGTQIFKSPESGWTLVATADFNGDGDDEIIAVGGNNIKVYDPQVVGSAYSFNATFSDGDSFTAVEIGDFSNDGSPDIALLRSYGGTTSHIVVYDLPNTTPVKDAEFTLTDWDTMAVGDYDSDGDDDFALTYWNSSYPNNLKSWFEIYRGDDPTQKIVGHYSNSVWFDIASGNFDTANGNQMEWVGSQNLSPNLAVQKLNGSNIANIWSLGTAFNFVATADFRGEGDDQVAMLRNVGSGVSLQFAKNSTVWSSLSGLGSGWLNLSAGNLDGEATYKEAVTIKSNLIRVFLQPQAGSGGSSTYLDCATAGNCFDITPAATLNGALAIGDLGIYQTSAYRITINNVAKSAVLSQTISSDTFNIYGKTALQEPVTWRAFILPASARVTTYANTLFRTDPNLDFSITQDGFAFNSTLGAGTFPTVEWVAMTDTLHLDYADYLTGTTPATITLVFSNTYAGSPLASNGSYQASLYIENMETPGSFTLIPISVVVASNRIYLPLVIK